MNPYTGVKKGPLLIWKKRIMNMEMSPRLWHQGPQRTTHQEVSRAEASQSIFPTFKEEGHTHCSQWDPRITVESFTFPVQQGRYIYIYVYNVYQNDSLWQSLARYSPNSLLFHGHTTAKQGKVIKK